jgi:hypothetical protein
MKKYYPNTYQCPNAVVDELLAGGILDPYQFTLLQVIIRKTRGWNRDTESIPLSEFEAIIPKMSRRTIIKKLKEMDEKNIITVIRKSGGNHSEINEYGLGKIFTDEGVNIPTEQQIESTSEGGTGAPDAHQGCTTFTPRGAADAHQGCTTFTPRGAPDARYIYSIKPNNKPNNKPSRCENEFSAPRVSDFPFLGKITQDEFAAILQRAERLLKWIDENGGLLKKFEKPLTLQQAVKLLWDYDPKEELYPVLQDLANTRKTKKGMLHQAYSDVNLTIRSWLRFRGIVPKSQRTKEPIML